jgi:hypothetical protein
MFAQNLLFSRVAMKNIFLSKGGKMKLGLVFFSLLSFAWLNLAEARTYGRYVRTCSFRLTQEDSKTASTDRLSFKIESFATKPSNGDFILPKLVLTPDPAIPQAEWAAFESRIRGDLELSKFSERAGGGSGDVHFNGSFNLNYDGIYDLIKVLGGTDLDFTDDLAIQSNELTGPDVDGRYRFNLRSGFGSGKMQAHLPAQVKNGLSFHIRWSCATTTTGVY